MNKTNVAIIGSGPAGYTAAIYAARAHLKPTVFEGFSSGIPGGQLMTTTDVENFPGFPEGVTGPQLMKQFRDQAVKFETAMYMEDVTEVDFSQRPFRIKTPKQEVLAESIIIATGASAKRIDIPGTLDGQLWQKGVTSCATCDGALPIFRDKPLYVIGGGDTACEEALFLTHYGSHVYVVHRRDKLRASKIMAKRLMEHPKITILWDSVVSEVKGSDLVDSVVIENVKTNEKSTHQAAGLFFAIGHHPNTSFLKGQINLHDNGYIKVKPGSTQTNIDGVFACGDVQDWVYRQAITAAGSGCMAALECERWLMSNEIID